MIYVGAHKANKLDKKRHKAEHGDYESHLNNPNHEKKKNYKSP